jgi:HPt (histidine-containing phosphotransfer) domain-containing protein
MASYRISFCERHDCGIIQITLNSYKKINEAIELIHAFKGVTSNLSAVALTKVSSHLLEELRTDVPLTSRAAFETILVETLRQIQQHSCNYRQPDRIKAKIITSISLKAALLPIEPFIIGQEIIPDELMDVLRQFADANLPDYFLLQELLRQIDNFEHTEALATLNLMKDKHLEH